MTERLSPANLEQLPAEVRRPAYDRNTIQTGLVHLGVGAFHRTHQAVYTEDAIEAGGGDWGVVGVSLRSRKTGDQLNPQSGLFTVDARTGESQDLRVIGNISNIITAPDGPAEALSALTAASVHAVTLTITEKGYGLDPASGELMVNDGDIAADLANPSAPRSAIGYIVAGLRSRRQAGIAPFTVISCDNIPANGRRLHSALTQYANAFDKELARFIETEVACPETMVDRIAPATTSEDINAAAETLGMRDEGYVKTEPFKQWVIEDKFCAPRPAWQKAGAMIVDNVAPFETAKLRLLNGAHSTIAYLGYLAGCSFVHEVMCDSDLAPFIEALMDNEITPVVETPKGMPLDVYARDLRERFLNSSLQHKTWQIAMDGSQKLPQRILNTIRDRIRTGASYDRLALAVAAWMTYASGKTLTGESIDVRDPLAERTAEIARNAHGNAEKLVSGFLNISEIFGTDLPSDSAFAGTVLQQLKTLHDVGPRRAAKSLS